MESLFWTAYSSDDRHAAINSIKDVISKYGDLVNAQFFSDLSLSMTIEIEELKIDTLYDALNQVIAVQRQEYLKSISKKERTVYLNITFAKGTGNLKIEVPAVPG